MDRGKGRMELGEGGRECKVSRERERESGKEEGVEGGREKGRVEG